MKVIAINGSPRKNGNTAKMLKSGLEGARENGAETQIYNLYDLKFTGCVSCLGESSKM
jgi:multimeric flavodoxin WrbA